MSEEYERVVAVRYWWGMAEESMAAARRELDAGSFSFAVNRLYYALFYAATAALLERRLSFTKHTGVRVALHREFIKTGLLDAEFGKLYDRLFEDRQEGDYVALVSFDKEYVEANMARCREFLDRLRPLVASVP